MFVCNSDYIQITQFSKGQFSPTGWRLWHVDLNVRKTWILRWSMLSDRSVISDRLKELKKVENIWSSTMTGILKRMDLSCGFEQTPPPVWIKPQFTAAVNLWPCVIPSTSLTEAGRDQCDVTPVVHDHTFLTRPDESNVKPFFFPNRATLPPPAVVTQWQSSAAPLCLYHEIHPSLTLQTHSSTLRKQDHHTQKSSPCIHFYCFAPIGMTGWTTGCYVLHGWWASVHQNNCSLTLWHDSDHGGQHLHLFVVEFSHHYDII